MPPYIEEFIKVVYTIGNFIPVPYSPDFNTGRSKPTEDYWDLTLKAIHDHYMGNSEKQTWLSELLGKGENISNWPYGKGQEGWNNFVRSNFMEPFVKKNGDNFGEPYELWDGHFNGKKCPQKEPQFEQFFVNAKVRIRERGKLIAEKLIDNQKDEQFYNDDCKSDK